jgi:hypothetical protein
MFKKRVKYISMQSAKSVRTFYFHIQKCVFCIIVCSSYIYIYIYMQTLAIFVSITNDAGQSSGSIELLLQLAQLGCCDHPTDYTSEVVTMITAA